MAYIYKITNLLNNQIYIGLTTRTVDARWKEHCRHNSQLIDKAIEELGKENFSIETIEECDEGILDEREQYWINYYDSFNSGYNNTLGGRDNNYVMTNKIELVLSLWNEGLTVNRIVEQTKLNVETVRSYLNKNGIDHNMIQKRANRAIGLSKSKPVLQYDLNGNFIQEWPTAIAAAEALNLNNTYITAACRHEKNTYANMQWIYKGDKLKPLINNTKAVCQYDLNNNFIQRFNSIGDAYRATKIDRGSISKACNGQLKTAGKFKWRYEYEGIY